MQKVDTLQTVVEAMTAEMKAKEKQVNKESLRREENISDSIQIVNSHIVLNRGYDLLSILFVLSYISLAFFLFALMI